MEPNIHIPARLYLKYCNSIFTKMATKPRLQRTHFLYTLTATISEVLCSRMCGAVNPLSHASSFRTKGQLDLHLHGKQESQQHKQQAYRNPLVLFRKARKPKYSPAHQCTYVYKHPLPTIVKQALVTRCPKEYLAIKPLLASFPS
jgi:hypothetical protein